MALSMNYPHPDKQTTFPGRNTQQQLIVEHLDEQISRIVGEKLTPTPNTGHARCRITLADDKGRGHVHIDSSDWSAILYLSLQNDCKGGTEFFRHKRTGTEHAPITKEELKAQGYGSFKEMVEDIVGQDGNDPDKWEKTMTIPMRYNRLVILRPWLWHTAGPAFGDKLENGRLVYLMFYSGESWFGAN